MQYILLASAALAATVFAQESASQSEDAAELISVVSVLQTALPSTLVQEALTNPTAVSAEIASEFAAGSTPAWFTALPSDVQTYLIPAGALPTVNATLLTTLTSESGAAPFATGGNGTATGGNATTRSVTRSASLTRTSEASATGDLNASSSSSEAGASMPTAIFGMGLAGAVGLVGVLAL